MVVADEEGLTQTDLVERTGIDRSTLADIVGTDARPRADPAPQRAKEDARAYAIKLTPKPRRCEGPAATPTPGCRSPAPDLNAACSPCCLPAKRQVFLDSNCSEMDGFVSPQRRIPQIVDPLCLALRRWRRRGLEQRQKLLLDGVLGERPDLAEGDFAVAGDHVGLGHAVDAEIDGRASR